MQGVGNVDQMQDLVKQMAPMGQFGMKLFQQFMDSGASMAKSANTSAKKDGD